MLACEHHNPTRTGVRLQPLVLERGGRSEVPSLRRRDRLGPSSYTSAKLVRGWSPCFGARASASHHGQAAMIPSTLVPGVVSGWHFHGRFRPRCGQLATTFHCSKASIVLQAETAAKGTKRTFWRQLMNVRMLPQSPTLPLNGSSLEAVIPSARVYLKPFNQAHRREQKNGLRHRYRRSETAN